VCATAQRSRGRTASLADPALHSLSRPSRANLWPPGATSKTSNGGNMKEAVIYTRVSTCESAQLPLGEQAQLLREYAKHIEAQIVNAFEDVQTARVTGRKQFSNMVTWFKRNRSCRILLVEKTDRLYRNFRDAMPLENLDIEIHFVKENQIISKESKSQDRLMHGIHLLLERNYSESLREEVKKGMLKKALGGVYPGQAPFGYKNNKTERTIEIDPLESPIVSRIFELYAPGKHSMNSVSKVIMAEYGKRLSEANIRKVLQNRFYVGEFSWGNRSYSGAHPVFLRPALFDQAQAILKGRN
jgi:DNA invertase Pin-like site-specific DNA recombinase